MSTPEILSWGRFPRVRHRAVVPLFWSSAVPLASAAPPLLAHGLGRSYGDSCLNEGGTLLLARGLDRFAALDPEAGLLTCEAGVSLRAILDLVVPRGLFLPVVPGTQHVTVGGAIASDVHGKNHHRAGTFGAHVRELELLRSDGQRLVCSPTSNAALFEATVGGLGLTGLITRATLALRRVPSPALDAEQLPLRGLEHFFEAAEAADAGSEFTVAWVDCLAPRRALGRGILFQANWAAAGAPARPRAASARVGVPFELPFSPLNRVTLGAFNACYHAVARLKRGRRLTDHQPFFFPLDAVSRWNRIYGPGGFLQFQCALPPDAAARGVRELLRRIGDAGEGSFLAVLKRFGAAPPAGLLSFPREGATLALDFPFRGDRTRRLFDALHAVVRDHAGRIYPAKDALMSGAQFRAQYADVLERFERQRDPGFSSSLWRRVMGDA